MLPLSFLVGRTLRRYALCRVSYINVSCGVDIRATICHTRFELTRLVYLPILFMSLRAKDIEENDRTV